MCFPTEAAQCIVKQRFSDHQVGQSRVLFSDEYLATDEKRAFKNIKYK